MITDTSPIAMLAADTLANQGAVRKDLGSLTAKGACTHVCMHPDAKTGRPCGHAWYLKPKATAASKRLLAVDPSFSDSVQSRFWPLQKNRDFPGFESRFGRNPGFREIGNPDLAGIPDLGNRESRFCRARENKPRYPGIGDFGVCLRLWAQQRPRLLRDLRRPVLGLIKSIFHRLWCQPHPGWQPIRRLRRPPTGCLASELPLRDMDNRRDSLGTVPAPLADSPGRRRPRAPRPI